MRRLGLRLGLRVKLLASFVLILLPVLGLLIYGYRDANEQRVRDTLDDQLRTAQAVAAVVDARFDEALVLTTALANNPVIQTLDPSRIDPYLTQLVANYPQYETLAVVNRSGDNVGVSQPLPPGSNRQGLAADRPYFQQLMTTGQPVVSAVIISRASLLPTIAVGVPIRDPMGDVIGAALVGVYLEALSTGLQSEGLMPQQRILLVDTMGIAAFESGTPDIALQQLNLRDVAQIKAALQGQSVEVRHFEPPILGGTRLAAFVPSPKYNWVIGVSLPEVVALAPVNRALQQQLIGLGAIAVLSAALILLLSSLLLRPVRRLRHEAKALGRGDLSRRVTIKTGDEMEQLGDTFNEMAERLDRTMRDLRAVLDASESGILMYDRDLVVRLVNRRLAEWFGLSPDTVIGKPVEVVAGEIIGPMLADPQGQLDRAHRLAEHPDEPIREELDVARPEFRVLRLYVGPVRVNGERIGEIEVYTDITDLRRREQERQALGEVAAALVRETVLERVADIVVEEGQRVFQARSIALFAADLQREELRLIGQRGLSAASVGEEGRLPFTARVISSKAARTGQPQEVPDVMEAGAALAGSRRIAEREGHRQVFAQPLFAKGRLVGVLMIARAGVQAFSAWERELIVGFADLCAAAVENARLYEELREALELREEFISAAAHELKTPVSTIKGYAQAMRKWAPEGHEPREKVALEVIDRQCDRISRRVQEMLEAVRLRSASPEQYRVPFDLGELASEAVRRIQPTTGHRLVLKQEVPAPVKADRERIEEVVVSLFDNAIKFSPEGRDIVARVFSKGREAVFSVRDEGVGIARERQAHIFEPFYEAAPAGTPGYRGVTALSLYLSKLTIELHGGRIWFESEEGKGATFYFGLPLAVEADATREKAGA